MYFLEDHHFVDLCSDQLYDWPAFSWLPPEPVISYENITLYRKNDAVRIALGKNTTEFPLSAQKQTPETTT